MATNKVSEGKTFEYEGDGSEVSGGIKVFADMVGVNLIAGVDGKQVVAAVEGVWDMPKATGDTFAQGAKVGVVGGLIVAASASGAVPAGNCATDIPQTGVATVPVRLNSW